MVKSRAKSTRLKRTTRARKVEGGEGGGAEQAKAVSAERDASGGDEYVSQGRKGFVAEPRDPQEVYAGALALNDPKVENRMPPIPAFLLVTPEEARSRADHWEIFPPKALTMFELPTKTKQEDEDTRLFREQVEAEKEAKKARMFEKLKRSKERKKIDTTGMRWSSRHNKFVPDPSYVHPGAKFLVAAEPKVKALEPAEPPKAKKPVSDKPKVARAAKGAPIVRDCAAEVKPLPEKGKRREVALACFYKKVKMSELASKLECSEGSVRSHLTDLHQKHGFGYRIEEGAAQLIAPKGWVPA